MNTTSDAFDRLRALRPFPHDAQTSFEACEEVYEVHADSMDDVTAEQVATWVAEAARGHRYLCICIAVRGERLGVEELLDRAHRVQELLQNALPAEMADTMNGQANQEMERYRVRLYGYKEAPHPPEMEARTAAFLARHGLPPMEDHEPDWWLN